MAPCEQILIRTYENEVTKLRLRPVREARESRMNIEDFADCASIANRPDGLANRQFLGETSSIARKRWNTSFESKRPRGVRRTTFPDASTRPSDSNCFVIGKTCATASHPNLSAISRKSTPRFKRNPRKKPS